MDSWLAVFKDVGQILGFTNAYGLTGGGGGQQTCPQGYTLVNGICNPPIVKDSTKSTSYPTWLPYAVIGVGALSLAIVVKKIMK